MKIVTKLSIQIISGLCVLLSTAVMADNTAYREVERIQISASSGTVYIRPKDLGTWGGTGCPGAKYAAIPLSLTGATEIINLAMASKLNGSKVYFAGTCDADPNYFNVAYAILD